MTPAAFFGVTVGRPADLILPLRLLDRLSEEGRSWDQPFVTWLQMIGRLKAGVPASRARSELTQIYRQSFEGFPVSDPEEQTRAREAEMQLVPAASGFVGGAHAFVPALRFLMIVLYLPLYQTPWASQVTFLLRHAGALDPIVAAVRENLQSIDPNLPLYRINTLEVQAVESLLRQRLLAWVSTLFGLVALALASVGLYGLMSFAVARRVKEIGLRMALGAQQRDVLWMTLKESLVLVSAGLLVGVPSALLVMRVAQSFLFGLTPRDPLTLALAITTLTVVAVVAS